MKQFNHDDILLVTNRSMHSVAYPVPESNGNLWRDFDPSETKKITYGEIEAACMQHGSRVLFQKYLMISDPEAATEVLNKQQEPEYFMTAEQVKAWLPTCSLDELLDALDFAPDGVLTLIKQYAVELPVNDMNKCKAISEKLKFDVLKAIELKKAGEEENEETPEPEAKRRVAVATAPQTGRRAGTITIPGQNNK